MLRVTQLSGFGGQGSGAVTTGKVLADGGSYGLIGSTAAILNSGEATKILAADGGSYGLTGTAACVQKGGGPAADFIARTTGMDGTHVTAFTNLINGLVSDGIWAKLDMLHVYATNSSANALLNLVGNVYNGTTAGSPTFTADRGFRGAEASATMYIDTGFNPATASSPKFTLNSAHISAWAADNAAPGYSQYAIMGLAGSSADTLIIPRSQFGGDTRYSVNNSTQIIVVRATQEGYFLANRSASNAVQGYKNGASDGTGSATASGLINGTFTTLSTNLAGTGNHFGGPHQCAMASIGASLTGTEVGNFYTRLRTYMTAVGVP